MMKMNNFKILFPLIFLVGITNIVFAQPQVKDSSEAYNYWAQRGIIEMLSTYMKDQESRFKLSAEEKEGIQKYESRKESSLNTIESTTVFITEIPELLQNNSWKSTYKLVFLPLKNKFDNNVLLNSNFFSIDAKSGGQYTSDNWKKQQEEILSNYSSALEKFAERHKTQEPVVSQPIVKEKQEQDASEPFNRHNKNSNVDWLKWTKYFGIFLIGLLLGGSLVFFISKRKIYSILDFEKDKYLHDLRLSGETFIFKYIGLFYVLKKRKEDYKNEIDGKNGDKSNILLKEQIETLKRENLKLKQLNDASTKQIQSIDEKKSSTQEWNIEKPQKTKQKLFFSMPENDGSFIIDNGEPSNDGRKYFRIEFFEDSENGDLFFIPSERDKRAINRLESYLKPVCEIENIANAENATRIEFISPGKVNSRNNRWLIESDNKVKIKLI